MSFFEFLEHLRQRPIEDRRKVAMVASVALITLIIVVWLSTVSIPSIGVTETSQPREEESGGPKEALQHIEVGVKEFWKSVQSLAKNFSF